MFGASIIHGTPSISRPSYFLTIVDNFSRVAWAYLLKHKNEARNYLVDFHNIMKTQLEKQIKRITTDNGGEFISGSMKEFYVKEGIILETNCPHTPQQNGVVERKYRHILEIPMALKFKANLPIKFRGESVLTKTYIINRLPSKVIKEKTPYEVLFG